MAFLWDAAKSAVGDAVDWVGGVGEDYMNAGKNRTNVAPYSPDQLDWGGQYGVDNIAQPGFQQAMNDQQMSDRYGDIALQERGPQAFENQYLSDNEAMSRDFDQAGALQLAREAAMGQGPSAATYQLQQGLDRGLQQQQALAGSARGAGALALAGANANAAGAQMQNQAATQAGQLRAQEMQQAQQLYGGLSGQQREQDLARLGQGSQMSQYNAGLNDQYRLGMGNLGNQASQAGQGWYTGMQGAYNSQANLDAQRQQIAADSYNQSQGLQSGINQANADRKAQQGNKIIDAALNTTTTVASGIGGSSPQAVKKP